MADVRFTEAALADLAHIYEWSEAEFGPEIADVYMAKLKMNFDLLVRHPEAGMLRTDLRKPYRTLPCRSHRIFYAVDDQGVRIVRVLHAAMSAERIL
ncbi:type II toxin-antitoxin system RelE/ParE family toxin [Sphingosinicella xenopeptidilytica]|uniref:Toxin n=1 Tax=Sphingosinicella xenopeptidilytica TaxID=364098 RepID=A0ABW3C807_SPHXN